MLQGYMKIIKTHTSGACPIIHLQSGENVSAIFTRQSSEAFANDGTLCNNCSSSTWKWSQSAGNSLPAEVSETTMNYNYKFLS